MIYDIWDVFDQIWPLNLGKYDEYWWITPVKYLEYVELHGHSPVPTRACTSGSVNVM